MKFVNFPFFSDMLFGYGESWRERIKIRNTFLFPNFVELIEMEDMNKKMECFSNFMTSTPPLPHSNGLIL